MNSEARWWTRPFRTFQTNLREIDAGLDVDRELDVIEAYGANVWLLSTAGIIANYPSTLSSQTVNPALAQRESGDLIGDAVTAAKARGLRVLGRMDFSKVDARRAEAHPEWCFVDTHGTHQVYNGYSSVCPSGPYYQQVMFDVVAEVLGAYDLSGFFFNWLSFNEYDYSRRYWGVCQCEACHAGFRAFAPGVPLPTEHTSPSYPRWREYTTEVLKDLTARMRAHVHTLNPDAALIQGAGADVRFHEANNAVGRPLWHHATAEAVSAARSGDPMRPVLVNSVGFVDMPYRWAGEDPEHFAQYLLQAMAHGAQPSTYVMGTTAHSPYEALQVGGQIVRFHRDNTDLYDGLHSAARVALVRGTGEQSTDRRSEFQGCYLALSERHVPFDVVALDSLPEVDPQRYDLIVLPDLGVLDPAAAASLDAALAVGAAVVATGDSAWVEGRSQLGGGGPARQLARYAAGEATRSLHLSMRDTDGGDLAPVVGGFAVLEPDPEAERDWLALGRARYGPPEQCYGHRRTGHPGWVSARVGAGRLAMIPWRPGLVYREIGLARVRDAWVEKVLSLSGHARQIETDLPVQAQIVHGQAPGRTVVHLLNRTGDGPQRFLEPVPIRAATLRMPARSSNPVVRARVAGAEPEWAIEGRDLVISLPEFGRFEVIDTVW